MENENEINEITKSENENKIKPTRNIIFFRNDRKLKIKNFFTNDIIKYSLEQSKENNFLEKSLIKNSSNMNIIKFNNFVRNNENIKMNNPIKLAKITKEIQKEIDKENVKTSIYLDKKLNIYDFFKHISVINKDKNPLNNSCENSFSFSKFFDNNYKRKPINIKRIFFRPNIPQETNKLKTGKNANNNFKNNIKYNKEESVKLKLHEFNFSKLQELSFLNKIHNLDNDINSTKKDSIARINFSTNEFKNKYLFGKMKKNNNIKNINIPIINSNNNKFSVLYKLKSIYEKNKRKDISKLNKIIYNIGDKVNLSKSSKKRNKSFFEETEKFPLEKVNSSISIYRKIIINNKVKKPINIKLNSLRIPNIKDNPISNINSLENENKLNSVPNKKNLINIMTLMELKHKK